MQKEKVCFCIEHFFLIHLQSLLIFFNVCFFLLFFFCVVQITRNYFASFWMSSIIFSKMCVFFFFLNLPTNFILIFSCQLTISCISFWMMKPITSRIKWYSRMRSADTAANFANECRTYVWKRERKKMLFVYARYLLLR